MLSNRKLKAFDRQGGAYLVLPWPGRLPATDVSLALDDERAATNSEHLAALPIAAPIAQRYGLIHLATQVAFLRMPGPVPATARPAKLWLLAHLVTARWQRVTTPGAPAPMQWMTGQ